MIFLGTMFGAIFQKFEKKNSLPNNVTYSIVESIQLLKSFLKKNPNSEDLPHATVIKTDQPVMGSLYYQPKLHALSRGKSLKMTSHICIKQFASFSKMGWHLMINDPVTVEVGQIPTQISKFRSSSCNWWIDSPVPPQRWGGWGWWLFIMGLGLWMFIELLVGGWTNPSEKILVKIWSFPQVGLKIKRYSKPPPS